MNEFRSRGRLRLRKYAIRELLDLEEHPVAQLGIYGDMRSKEQRRRLQQESIELLRYSEWIRGRATVLLQRSRELSLAIQKELHVKKIRQQGKPAHGFVAFPRPWNRRAA